jgi:ABC-type Fe3+ transport system substrate-binding protein
MFFVPTRRAQEQGLPVSEISPYHFKEAPGIGSNNGAIGLMNAQPHPNGAKVFINWYLSREGQIAFRNANNTFEDETTTSLREGSTVERRSGSRTPAQRCRLYRNQPARLDGMETGGRCDQCGAAEVGEIG